MADNDALFAPTDMNHLLSKENTTETRDVQLNDRYKRVKYKLNHWESQFLKKTGRQATKQDVQKHPELGKYYFIG